VSVQTTQTDGDNQSVATTAPPKKRRRRNRIGWAVIEVAFVQGGVASEGPNGEPTERTYPTLDELAVQFKVSRRQIAYRSSRDGWVSKRHRYQENFALELHRDRTARMLKEAAGIDAAALTGSKMGLHVVLRHLQIHQRSDATPRAASESETLSRALERFHKTARLSLSLPTELLQSAEDAEKRRLEQETASGASPDGMAQLLEKLGKLEGAEFLETIDRIIGGTPAGHGQVIEMAEFKGYKAIPARSAPA
jgi:hypothetical protein